MMCFGSLANHSTRLPDEAPTMAQTRRRVSLEVSDGLSVRAVTSVIFLSFSTSRLFTSGQYAGYKKYDVNYMLTKFP